MVTPEQIVAEARALIGAPFSHRGRGPVGYDCLGLVLTVAWRTGLVPASFDFTNYTTNVADYELQQHLETSPYLVRLASWRHATASDILLQRFHSALPASHLILITVQHRKAFWGVHASQRHGVVEQRVAHLERNVTAYRLKGVASWQK